MHLIRQIILILVLTIVGQSSARAEEESGEPLYYELSPSIVVNIKNGAKYTRCDIQLMTRGEEQLAAVEFHAAALRNEFLLLIPEFDGTVLETRQGKEKLRDKALGASQKIMQELTGSSVIEGIYFTSFFVR